MTIALIALALMLGTALIALVLVVVLAAFTRLGVSGPSAFQRDRVVIVARQRGAR